jgi:hypothetical protein
LLSKVVKARVVSAPCLEWFNQQSDSYSETIFLQQSARASALRPESLKVGVNSLAMQESQSHSNITVLLLLREFSSRNMDSPQRMSLLQRSNQSRKQASKDEQSFRAI